jgi:hypothetical protein
MMRFPAMTICSYVCQSLFWWSFQMLYDRCVFWNGFILDLAWEGLDGEAATEGSKEDQQCPFWCIIILVAVAWGSTRASSWRHVPAERFDPRTYVEQRVKNRGAPIQPLCRHGTKWRVEHRHSISLWLLYILLLLYIMSCIPLFWRLKPRNIRALA